MILTKTHKVIISIVIVVIFVAMYIVFDMKSRRNNGPSQPIDTTIATTSTFTSSSGVSISGPGGYTIEEVPVVGQTLPQPIPDLSRSVIFNDSLRLTSEAKTAITVKVTKLQTELKKNANYLAAWIDLGIYQKMAGDYTGTIESWVYATKLSPNNFVAYGNLGDLYAYYIKDNAMAESYYKQAIAKGPTQVYLYTQLADVYKDVFKDLDKARAIIDQGLLKIPKDPALLQYKANLK